MYAKVPAQVLDETPSRVSVSGEAPNTVEHLLEIVGTSGWRNYIAIMLCMSVSFILPMHLVTYEFLGDTPQHRCEVPHLNYWSNEEILQFAIPLNNETGRHDNCKMYEVDYMLASQQGFKFSMKHFNRSAIITCKSRVFLDKEVQSIVTDWDLVCDRRWLYSSTQSATMAGMLFGALLCGYLVDAYGRRRMIMMAAPAYLFIGMATCLSPNISTYIALKLLIAFLGSIFGLAPITLAMELCSTEQRSYVGSWSAVPWALGYISVAGITYLVRPWRYLQVALTAPILLQLPNYWYLPESPRWLIDNGRYEDATLVLKTFAEANNRTLPSNDRLIGIMHKIHMVNRRKKSTEPYKPRTLGALIMKSVHNYTAVIRMKEFRARTLNLYFVFFTCAMVYYGISLNSSRYSSNKYLYVFINGVLEIPAYLALGPIIAFFGRRRSLSLFLFISGGIIVTALGYDVVTPQESETILMILNLIGKFNITCAFTLVFIYTNELYPTRYRSMALGQASGVGRIGSVSSPYINDLLGDVTTWAPSAVFGISSLISAISSLFLPETVGKDLEEEIH